MTDFIGSTRSARAISVDLYIPENGWESVADLSSPSLSRKFLPSETYKTNSEIPLLARPARAVALGMSGTADYAMKRQFRAITGVYLIRAADSPLGR